MHDKRGMRNHQLYETTAGLTIQVRHCRCTRALMILQTPELLQDRALVRIKYALSSMGMLRACMAREVLLVKHNLQLYGIRSLRTVMIAVCVALTFFHSRMPTRTQADAGRHFSVLFFTILIAAFDGRSLSASPHYHGVRIGFLWVLVLDHLRLGPECLPPIHRARPIPEAMPRLASWWSSLCLIMINPSFNSCRTPCWPGSK